MSVTASGRGDSDNIGVNWVAVRPHAPTERGGYTKAVRIHANHPIDDAPLSPRSVRALGQIATFALSN